jgi:acetoacetyl-CoA synthetase
MTQASWRPSKTWVSEANLTRFIKFVQQHYSKKVFDYHTLYQWSVEDIENFWQSIWQFCGVTASQEASVVLEESAHMTKAKFFPGAKLNYAQNLIENHDTEDVIVFWGEDKVKKYLTRDMLRERVSKVAQAMKEYGVNPGDRVAGYVPNTPETLICALAATSLGAVWSSCSPDFGVSGVLDRFEQIDPKVLIVSDKYLYRGRYHDCLDKVCEIQKGLPSLQKTIVFSYDDTDSNLAGLTRSITLKDVYKSYAAKEIEYAQQNFADPLFIMFSSGTTGIPKCIIHSVGGTLIQHMKEHQLHSDIKAGDRVFYFSTCGWMMWNWHISALASGATLLIYDGSPLYPNGRILFDFIDEEAMTFFGTSAKFIDALNKKRISPKSTHKLTTLRAIASTGSPLVPEAFDYVYREIKEDILLASISGGTDIISCFALGNPIAPVYRGEIQTRGLGMAVDIYDEEGKSIRQEKGELVCTKPFPSMPIGFWNDPEDKKYKAAYFEEFDAIWCHGDFAELTDHEGIIIYGRSDAVLNPGGIRIGTAEIYRQVEQINEISEGLVIGQNFKGDVRIVLFVIMQEGIELTAEIIQNIKDKIRANTTPRHVPSVVIQVKDIPRTKSGKIAELAVKNIVEGRSIKNKDALANPESLTYFEGILELQV